MEALIAGLPSNIVTDFAEFGSISWYLHMVE